MSVCQQRLLARMSTEKETLQTRQQNPAVPGTIQQGTQPLPGYQEPHSPYQQTQPQYTNSQLPTYTQPPNPSVTSQSQQPPIIYVGYNTNHPVTFIPAPVPKRSLFEAYLLTLLLGFTGAQHFYLRRPEWGVVYLFTLGFLGCGWVIDLFRLPLLVSLCNKQASHPETSEKKKKNLDDAYVCWLPAGFLGLHHFYLNNIGLGVVYFFTFGLFGVGWVADAFLMSYHVKKANSDIPDDSKKKSTATTCILAISPAGILGAHHYYLNRIGFGIAYTLTFGLFGVGYIVDWCRFPLLVQRYNKSKRKGFISHKHLDDAYLLWFPLGFLGLHHFYLNRPGWGCLYFFTFGLFGLGWIIDGCRLCSLVTECNRQIDEQVLLSSNNQGISNPNFVAGSVGTQQWPPAAGGHVASNYTYTSIPYPPGYTANYPAQPGLYPAGPTQHNGYGSTSGVGDQPPPYEAGPLPTKEK
ncbi:uncharacterized protein LOC134262941 [Saccostrea cucullata]|uniref:uncharacterized protein LOC134262941 n=1 Tax=Saccostrea cuccullata TaxID=36930 RepID=UPI002ED476FE